MVYHQRRPSLRGGGRIGIEIMRRWQCARIESLGGSVMQAVVVPAVSSSWQLKEVPQPQPGSNQVLVKMHASGICYTDVHQTLGHLPGSFPRILGHVGQPTPDWGTEL